MQSHQDFVRSDKIHIDPKLLERLYAECSGYAQRVFEKCSETGKSPAKVAIQLADEMAMQPHPLFGHRGQQIIDTLISDEWFKNE